MAMNFESSVYRGSDLIFDFSCFTCQENETNKEAEFYCEECSKFFCGKCVELHNSLFKKHEILGKENLSKWPVSDVDALEQCPKHKKEKLTGFCEDHSELICHGCHIYNHQKCSHVVLIADKVKALHQKGEFKLLSETFNTLHGQLIQRTNDFDESLQSFKASYNNILDEINAVRKAVNASLDRLEMNTIKELDTILAKMRKSIETDIENCTESIKSITCVQEEWLNKKDISDTLNYIKYRECLNQSLNADAVLKEMTTQNKMTLTFIPDSTIQQTMSTLSGLGQILSKVNIVPRQIEPEECEPVSSQTQDEACDKVLRQTKSEECDTVSSQPNPLSGSTKEVMVTNPVSKTFQRDGISNQSTAIIKSSSMPIPESSSYTKSIPRDLSRDVNKLLCGYQPTVLSEADSTIKVISSQKYRVKIESDRNTRICGISGICETLTGELLITDWSNKKLKLLNKTYQVVADYQFPGFPVSICSIDSNLVAVALGYNEVHFIRVTLGLFRLTYYLVQDRALKLKHSFNCITHHQGILYIASGKALLVYTMNGKHAFTMYQGISVDSCAVSPDGDRIYVVDQGRKQLVTLSADGTVLSTLTDNALGRQYNSQVSGLHVTDSKQVLVCANGSNAILQIDRDGRKILKWVVTVNDGVICPTSVFYSKRRGALIVGMNMDDSVMVFKAQ